MSRPPAPRPADDPTPDAGPVHRGGGFTVFAAIAYGLAAGGGALLLHRQGQPVPAAACLAAFGTLAAWAGWCLLEHFRHRTTLPRSHAVLTGVLGFEIPCTCRDVAATVFFDPDRLSAGGRTRLLCFVENYASRRRVARFCLGPHRALGLDRPLTVDLPLAAGQAAVHELPLTAAATLPAGEHDLPVVLTVTKPAGTGVRLPGTRRHLYDIWTVHFAAPFTVDPAAPPVAAPAPAGPRCVTLASVSEPAPRRAALEDIAGGG
jgi:hypothetical protein